MQIKLQKMEKQHYSALLEKDDPANIIFQEDNIPLDLQDLDKTFRCSICGSLFGKAVTIKNCGHTYCSVCIRNHWVASRNGKHRKDKSCPMCRNAVDQDVDKALVMNRNIQEGVEVFKLMLLKTHKSPNQQIKDSSSSYRKRRRRAVREVSNNIDYGEGSNEDHENDCYNDNEEEEDEDQESTIQKRMQSRNYGRMGKRDLQNLCREYTLPTSGKDEDLKKRLRTFQCMWNAEIDSINPLKPSDLVKKLKKMEQAQRDEKNRALISGAANDSEHLKKLNASLKRENKVITSGNEKFDKRFNGNFERMEAQLRERESGSASVKSSTEVIEIIDIDFSSDLPDGDRKMPAISSSETDQKLSTAMNEENDYVPYPARPILAPNKKSVSTSTNSSSSFSACGLRSIKNQYTANSKKRRPSPSSNSSSSPANSSTWACTYCTFENMSPHNLCTMCSKRKIEN